MQKLIATTNPKRVIAPCGSILKAHRMFSIHLLYGTLLP